MQSTMHCDRRNESQVRGGGEEEKDDGNEIWKGKDIERTANDEEQEEQSRYDQITAAAQGDKINVCIEHHPTCYHRDTRLSQSHRLLCSTLNTQRVDIRLFPLSCEYEGNAIEMNNDRYRMDTGSAYIIYERRHQQRRRRSILRAHPVVITNIDPSINDVAHTLHTFT